MPTTPRRPQRSPRTVPDEGTAAAYDAAWVTEAPAGDAWTARPWVHPTERAEAGKAARKRVPRSAHAAFEPAPDRDPIAILAAQEADRLPELVPLRHERMAESAFAYYRGTPAVMAFDLADNATLGHPGPGQWRRPHQQLRAVRLAGASARVRRQRLRRDAARSVGVGRQAPGYERHDRRARQRLRRLVDPQRHDGRRPKLPLVDGPLCRDAPHRRPLRLAHGGRHP